MENKVLDGSEDFGHGITSLPESWNKYNTSSYLGSRGNMPSFWTSF